VPLHLKTCAAVVTAAILGLAACGDDDDADAAGTADEARPAADGGADDDEGGEGDGTAAYCDASLAIETAPPPDVDFATATPEELAEALKAHAADLQPLADDIMAAAPAEIEDELGVLDEAVDEMAATGVDIWEVPATNEASDAVHAYDVEHCGWEVVDVAAGDYAFDGLPAELPAGPTAFELANEGDEVHELILLRKGEGVTLTPEELLAMPEEEAMAQAEMVGSPAFAAPGDTAYTVKDLEPGEYIAICFIPTGMTGVDGPPPEGPPHAVHGMHAELTVT
jgi:hypothetical protein